LKNNTPLKLVPPEAKPTAPKPKRSTLRDTKAQAARKKKPRAAAPITFEQAGELLGRPIAYHPIHADIAGSVEAGVFLGQALYWTRIQDATNPAADGWFYKTQAEWHEETRLKRDGQESARKALIRRGLLMEETRALPPPSYQARLFFKVNRQNYLAALWEQVESQSGAMHQTRKVQSTRQERRKAPDKPGAFPQSLGTEITSQTTSKTTSSSGDGVDDESFLIRDLIALGVTPNRAKKVAPAAAPELRRRLEFLPHLKNIENPAALICSHLDEPWNEPPALARQRAADIAEVQAAADARAAVIRRQADERRQHEMQDQDDQLDAQYKSLDELDRADVDERARQHLTRVMGETRETPAALAIARRAVLRKEFGGQAENDNEE
jgi:hypothetical protein